MKGSLNVISMMAMVSLIIFKWKSSKISIIMISVNSDFSGNPILGILKMGKKMEWDNWNLITLNPLLGSLEMISFMDMVYLLKKMEK